MASSSFQNITIADYLRILFQRMWIIILCTLISVFIAGYFAIFNMQKRYESSMDIRVVRKHSRNPFLKKLLTTEDLNMVIRDLKDRLQGEKRLLLLAKNLRLSVKNEYIKKYHLSDYSLDHKSEIKRIFSNLNENDRLNIFIRMELVTLAKILGAIPPESIDPFEMINGSDSLENSEYLINENDEYFIRELRKMVADDEEKQSGTVDKITSDQIRQRAVVLINNRFKTAHGIDSFEKKQLWEIHKELLSIDRLMDVNIYSLNVNKSTQKRFISSLRGGLEVGVTQNNFMHLLFDVSHNSLKEAVPHLVVKTAYEMIRAEYYASEEGVRNDAKREMRKQIARMDEEILQINKKLANHENLINLQLAYSNTQNVAVLEDETRQDSYQFPRISTHIQNLNNLANEKRELEGEIEAKKASIRELEETLRDPSKVRIVQKTIKIEESPASRAMQAEKARKEEELRRLRLDATEKHPTIQKLLQEIQQINLALSGLDSPIETTVEKEHPMVSQWKAQRIMHKEEIAVLQAKIKKIEKSIKIEMEKAIEAPQKLQEYETLQSRKSNLTTMLNSVQQDLEKLLSEENVGKGIMRTEFEVYRSPVKPTMHYAPKIEIIIIIGFVIGLVTALAAIFFIEYTDHSIKGIEDAKRCFDIPILGTIPEFEFQEVERSHINRGMLLRKLLGKEQEVSMSSKGHENKMDIITTKKSKYMRTIVLILLSIALLLLIALLYTKSTTIYHHYMQYKTKVMERLDMLPHKPIKYQKENNNEEENLPENNEGKDAVDSNNPAQEGSETQQNKNEVTE